MVSYSDVLNNLKTLLDKFYVRKQKNDYNLNGVVVTNGNREITTAQSISASSSMISGLSTVATSGLYSDLTGKPTKVSDFTNDSGYLTSHQTVDSSLNSSSTNPVQNKVFNTALNGKLDTVTDKLTTNTHGTALSELKVGSTSKGTIYHPKVLSDTVSSGLYKITVNTDGHITGTASVGSSDLPSHTHSSDNITGLTASQNVVTNSSGKLGTEAKNNHAHGNVTSDGKVGSNANYFLYTGTGGAVTSKQKIGNITIDGAIGTTSGNIITTTTDGVLQSSSSINSSKVTDDTANTYSNLGSLHSGVSQRVINSAINTKIGKIGEWVDVINSVIDWNHTTSIGSYSHCWYNESLQMIYFRFHYPFMSMQSATKYTWDGQGNTIGSIKVIDEVKPLSLVYGSAVASRGDDAGLGSIWVNSDGYFGGIFNKTFANTGTEVQVYGSIMWVLTDDIVTI